MLCWPAITLNRVGRWLGTEAKAKGGCLDAYPSRLGSGNPRSQNCELGRNLGSYLEDRGNLKSANKANKASKARKRSEKVGNPKKVRDPLFRNKRNPARKCGRGLGG